MSGAFVKLDAHIFLFCTGLGPLELHVLIMKLLAYLSTEAQYSSSPKITYKRIVHVG